MRGIGKFGVLILLAAPVAASDVPETGACLLLPSEVIELAAPVDGVIAMLEVERGDRVAGGQIVLRIDAAQEEAELQAAQARFDSGAAIDGHRARVRFLEAEALRSAQLVERSVAVERVRDEAAMELDTARANLAEAELARRIAGIEAARAESRMQHKTIRSPIPGLVVKRDVSVGEFHAAGAPLLTIAGLDVLRAEAFVPIAHHPALHLGQEVTIRPEAPFAQDHSARITVIDQVFDAATGTFGIVAELVNPEGRLPAGLRCTIRFN